MSNTHFVPRKEIYNNNKDYFLPNPGNVRGNTFQGQIYDINAYNQNQYQIMQNQPTNQNMPIQPQFMNNNNIYITPYQLPLNNNNYYAPTPQFTYGGINNNPTNNINYQGQRNIGYNNNVKNNK